MSYFTKHVVAFLLLISVFSCNKDEDGNGNSGTTDTSQLAQISINTLGATIVDDPKIKAEMRITYNNVVDYSGLIGIEIRGQSSQMFPKKQFGVETRDASGLGINVSLLGLPKEEDWILNAPYSDKSLVRNVLIYDLSRELGRYASRAKFVEVSINGSYNGLYVLLEKLKRDSNRINITKLTADANTGENVTGGYILKIDKAPLYNNSTAITSSYTPNNATANQKIYFNFDTPKATEITTAQKAYITNYLMAFEDALAGTNFKDSNLGYAKYIDVDSFIDFFLLNELSNNVDGYRLSTWLTKDKGEKLKMGPIWDFNLAFGNANYCGGGETNVWAYKFNERCSQDFWQIPFWWNRLLQDPAFVSKLKSRWSQLRNNTFSNGNILMKIDQYNTTLNTANAVSANFGKWPILSTYIWPNNYVGNTYNAEINYLKNWITQRVLWLDNAILAL